MTSTKKNAHAFSRLCEKAPQEPRADDRTAKLRVHHISLAREGRLDAAFQGSFAEIRPAEASQSFHWKDGRETKPLLSFEAPPALHNKPTRARWLQGPRFDAVRRGANLRAAGNRRPMSRAKP
ncbi:MULTISPECIES: hypothetical protein [unclassified Ensifer]|uniref:hypothetical protein n=1 Tax=unclassified Ensifer TaxID=2633371 RepID=UPI00070AB684|nr:MULTISPECIES: hypothetical protein [unclassified Ensifer]KQW33523.1 hypothetical protein ASD02_18945 [Ensifer sp. Root1252]KRC78697.1 hypothetical protein ASE32_26915 [Ensifer sp. Root231]KRD02600.1 hypothetical protein ASE47_20005 [Ensifer sp. Root258]